MITWKSFISHVAIILFALVFLYFGNMLASTDQAIFEDDFRQTVEARVERIIDISESEFDLLTMTMVTFEARITSGELRNSLVVAEQSIADLFADLSSPVSEGDRVVLVSFVPGEWYFDNFIRINQIIILGGIFVVLLLLFGRAKGFNAILSLGFTCVAVFAVFIPAILSGRNIYLSAVIICFFSIIVTILTINGFNRKSLAAIIGSFGGVAAAAVITLIMNLTLGLTGIVSGESINLLFLPLDEPINLRALIFAGIVIGAVGAVMDVAISISSALWELKAQAPELTVKEIYKSGINIGKDVMASMTNTLVLAYIGSSLSVILLMVVHVGSLTDLFNSELVIVELLQALIGSMGILLAMPLTAIICAMLFSGSKSRAEL